MCPYKPASSHGASSWAFMRQHSVLMRILLEIGDSKCIKQEIYEAAWELSFHFVMWVNLLLRLMLIYFINFSLEYRLEFLSKFKPAN